ncbi:MAG TPA: phosphotransferase [Caulobacterales bacterium]|nr:phosphotransferase [Caulobacterales bacterium]
MDDRPQETIPTASRYLDNLLSEMDRWIRPELQSEQSLFNYRSMRRVLVRLITSGDPLPVLDEIGAGRAPRPAGALSDKDLHRAVLDEAARMDECLRAGDVRLARADKAEDAPQVKATAIEAGLAALGYPHARVHDMKVVFGGRSKETILFSINGVPGLPRDLVMRRDLLTGSLGTRVVDEFALLEVLHAHGVRTPAPFAATAEGGAVGTPFLIMARARGRTAGEAVTAPLRSEQVLAAARALPAIHRTPTSAVATLPMFERPAASPQETAALVEKMARQWREKARTFSPAVEAAYRWLGAHAAQVAPHAVLVHGDYNFHNLLYDGDELTAVLDWELSHLGHPAEDLGYVKQCVEQRVSWDSFMAEYRDAGGLDVSLHDVHAYALLSMLRLIGYILHSRDLFESGAADTVGKGEVSSYFLPRLMQQVSLEMRQIIAEA